MAGYHVRIIDSTVTPDFHAATLREREDSAAPFEIWLNRVARRIFLPLEANVDGRRCSDKPVTC